MGNQWQSRFYFRVLSLFLSVLLSRPLTLSRVYVQENVVVVVCVILGAAEHDHSTVREDVRSWIGRAAAYAARRVRLQLACALPRPAEGGAEVDERAVLKWALHVAYLHG